MAEKRGPWQVLSRQQVYDNRWIRLTHHEVLNPAGQLGIYGTIHFKYFGLGVVPVDTEMHTYLVGQYRFALDAYSWEIPEGGGLVDGDPQVSAARELAEETGLRAARWRKVVEGDLSNSVTDEHFIGYLAWDLEQGTPAPEPTEQLQIRRLPLSEAFRMVETGEIRDALSILTLQAVQLLHLQGRLPHLSAA